MKYFLDSAKIDEIRYAYKYLKIDGVTTNPNHIKNSGKSFNKICKELAEEFKNVNFPISIEIDPHMDKAEDMIREGRKYASLSSNFVIKIACTEQGLIAAEQLVKEGIKTNITLVFSVSQALQAARINSTYVSPFIGWKENNGEDGVSYLKNIKDIYQNYGYKTEIIAAAVRNGYQIGKIAAYGIDIVTAGLSVYQDSLYHPFTSYGIQKFCKAWEETKQDE